MGSGHDLPVLSQLAPRPVSAPSPGRFISSECPYPPASGPVTFLARSECDRANDSTPGKDREHGAKAAVVVTSKASTLEFSDEFFAAHLTMPPQELNQFLPRSIPIESVDARSLVEACAPCVLALRAS
jgi:hypothetical protein